MLDYEAAEPLEKAVVAQAFFFGMSCQKPEFRAWNEQQHREQEEAYGSQRVPEPAQGHGTFARLSVPACQAAEDERRNEVGEQHDGEHPDDGHFRERAHSRMPRDDERAYAHEHYHRRESDAAAVGVEDFPPRGILGHESFGDEYRVVVSLSEDECGEDDVDDVEFYREYAHESQNPQPADGERKECEDGEFEAAEGNPEEYEDYEPADKADVVELFREHGDELRTEVSCAEKECVPVGKSCVPVVFHGGALRCRDMDVIDECDGVGGGARPGGCFPGLSFQYERPAEGLGEG